MGYVAYDKLYDMFHSKESGNEIYKIAKARKRKSKDIE